MNGLGGREQLIWLGLVGTNAAKTDLCTPLLKYLSHKSDRIEYRRELTFPEQ